jgi:Ribbon-helix-helix protein, copG family
MIIPTKRLQIHIEEDLDEALAVEATKQRTSKAALIRQAVAARYAPASTQRNDLLALSGIIEGAPDDSRSVDDVVYGRP